MNKVNIGSKFCLYPSLLGVVGCKVEGKANFLLVAHYGIVSHQHILVSMNSHHYSNAGIIKNGSLTINLVDEKMLPKADYVGSVSGAKVDKSEAFSWYDGETGAPIIEESPLTLECHVDDIYRIDGFDNFICSIVAVQVQPEYLKDERTIDYDRLKPILFESPLSVSRYWRGSRPLPDLQGEDIEMKYIRLESLI